MRLRPHILRQYHITVLEGIIVMLVKKNATAPPNVVNTSDTQYLSLETCIIMIFTRWYDQHCTLTVASGHTLK